MGIAGQILDDVLGTTKERLGVDDPVGLAQLVEPGMKLKRRSET
jgi:hypothetical protein